MFVFVERYYQSKFNGLRVITDKGVAELFESWINVSISVSLNLHLPKQF